MLGTWAIIAVIVFVVWAIKEGKRSLRAQDALIAELAKTGFIIDHSLRSGTYVAFDVANQKIAFVFGDATVVKEFKDVLEYSWLDKVVTFQLRDVDFPLVKIPVGSVKDAEIWFAKTQAIFEQE